MLCGSAFKNKGVQPLLDAVVAYLPAPTDVAAIKGVKMGSDEPIERRASDDEPFAGLAFKIMSDPFVGSLTFIRIYSGVLNTGEQVLNTVKNQRERIGRMLLMHANHREDVKEARAGDILALAGLKNTTTGDTLSNVGHPVVLEKMEFPDPVIEIAVEPKTKGDQEKMGQALARLATEDPSFRVAVDHESGQTVIKGMGELHLEIIVDRMKREFKVDANIGAPQVAYRETITRPAEIDYTHKKQTGGAGQYARVKIRFEPLPPGSGFVFENSVVGGAVPKEYVPGVEKGLKASTENGVLAGFPVIDLKADLIDGAYHDVDFERAGLRDRVPRRLQGRRAEGGAEAAGTDHARRGRHPGGLHGRRDRRSEQPARSGDRHGYARQRPRHQRDGAAREHVRVCQHAALDEPGPGAVHDAFRPLRAGAAGRRGRSPRQDGVMALLRDLTGEKERCRRRSLVGRSRIAMSGRSGMSITARRR